MFKTRRSSVERQHSGFKLLICPKQYLILIQHPADIRWENWRHFGITKLNLDSSDLSVRWNSPFISTAIITILMTVQSLKGTQRWPYLESSSPQLPPKNHVRYQSRVTVSRCEWWLADPAATQSWCHRFSARQSRRGATSPNPSLTSPPIRSTGKLHVSWKSLTSLSATSQCMKRSNLKETLRTNVHLCVEKTI